MTLEGKLVFDLYRDGSTVSSVNLSSSRPLKLVNSLNGRSAAEGIQLLGLMYRVCGVAQRYTALKAWHCAANVDTPPVLDSAQRLLVNMESVREHLWQVLIVWPELMERSPHQGEAIKIVSRLIPNLETALFKQRNAMSTDAQLMIDERSLLELLQQLKQIVEAQLLGMKIEAWQQIEEMPHLYAWAEQKKSVAACFIQYLLENQWQDIGRDSNVSAMPPLAENVLIEKFESGECDEFVARPTWQGVSYESNVYTRQADRSLIKVVSACHGSGLLTRAVARINELVELVSLIEKDATGLCSGIDEVATADSTGKGDGQGLATVEAARGRLIHWMKLKSDRIVDYAILAPTEWNFHPQGVAVSGLIGMTADDEKIFNKQAALWINAIDPCVGYELRIH